MKKLSAIIIALSLTSCATITSNMKQEIYISAKPDHASVYVDGQKVGSGDVVTDVRRNKRHTITVKADGYETITTRTYRQIRAGYVVGNIGMCLIPYVNLFGLPSLIVDACTGAWYKQEKDEFHFELDKK
jgi:hypothetical protein